MGRRTEREKKRIQEGTEGLRINTGISEYGVPNADRAGSLAASTWDTWKDRNWRPECEGLEVERSGDVCQSAWCRRPQTGSLPREGARA